MFFLVYKLETTDFKKSGTLIWLQKIIINTGIVNLITTKMAYEFAQTLTKLD